MRSRWKDEIKRNSDEEMGMRGTSPPLPLVFLPLVRLFVSSLFLLSLPSFPTTSSSLPPLRGGGVPRKERGRERSHHLPPSTSFFQFPVSFAPSCSGSAYLFLSLTSFLSVVPFLPSRSFLLSFFLPFVLSLSPSLSFSGRGEGCLVEWERVW